MSKVPSSRYFLGKGSLFVTEVFPSDDWNPEQGMSAVCGNFCQFVFEAWQFWDDVSYRVFANLLLEINIFCDCWSVSEGEPVPTCEVAHEHRNVVTLYHTDNKPTMWSSMEAWWLEWQSRWSLSCWPVGVRFVDTGNVIMSPFCELAHRRLPSGGLTKVSLTLDLSTWPQLALAVDSKSDNARLHASGASPWGFVKAGCVIEPAPAFFFKTCLIVVRVQVLFGAMRCRTLVLVPAALAAPLIPWWGPSMAFSIAGVSSFFGSVQCSGDSHT